MHPIGTQLPSSTVASSANLALELSVHPSTGNVQPEMALASGSKFSASGSVQPKHCGVAQSEHSCVVASGAKCASVLIMQPLHE